MMFVNSAKPTKHNLRTRAQMIVEAAGSGEAVGAKWTPKCREPKRKRQEYVSAMKNAREWAERALWVIDREGPFIS